MTDASSKLIRSPSYPAMPLRDAIDAVRKIEGVYRASPVDRQNAAKLIGYSSLSGPASKALAALASYGLLERAGKGETRVTDRAQAILYADDDDERQRNILAAATEPALFRALRERFASLDVPPEDGVVMFLNRQQFNPSAVRPAAKAFLQTMEFLREQGASESHGAEPGKEGKLDESGDNAGRPTFGGARIGDLVQWESKGELRLEKPERVRWISDDGTHVAVENSNTGIPMDQVIVEERAPTQPIVPPPIAAPRENSSKPELVDHGDLGTDLRFKVKGAVVRVSSAKDLDYDQLNALVTLLGHQRDALKDEE